MKANTLVLHGSKWNIFGKIKLRVKQKTFGTVLLDNVEGKQSADLSIVKIIVAALHVKTPNEQLMTLSLAIHYLLTQT